MRIGFISLLIILNSLKGENLEYVNSTMIFCGLIFESVESFNNYAYLVDKGYLYVIDISSPKTPALLGFCKVEGVRMAISYPYLYTVMGSGLRVIDISNPFNPAPIGSCKVFRGAGAIQIRDSLAYVGDYFNFNGSLDVINISNPNLPKRIGQCRTTDQPHGIALYGSYAYVGAWWAGIRIIDISDPTNPFEVNYLRFPGQGVEAIRVSYPYLYVTVADTPGIDKKDKFYILDISDPREPRIISHCARGAYHLYNIELLGNYVYLVGNPAYVIDISDPENPVEVNELWGDGIFYGSALTDSLLLFAGWKAKEIDNSPLVWSLMEILDLSDPENPKKITDYVTSNGLSSVAIKGRLLGGTFTGNSNGFFLLSLEDPSHPKQLGFLPFNDFSSTGVALSDSYAYVGYQKSLYSLEGGIHIIDITSPLDLKIVSSYCDYGVPWDIEVKDSFAYLAEVEGGLKILDISNPHSPTLLGHYEGDYRFLSLSYPFLYAVEFFRPRNRIDIFDISNPKSPQKIGEYMGREISGIKVKGSYAYIIESPWEGERALRVLDVSDPSNIREINRYIFKSQEEPCGIIVSGNYLYVDVFWYKKEEWKKSYYSLYGFDISDPYNLKKIGYCKLPFYPSVSSLGYSHSKLTTYGRWIYVPNIGSLEICRNNLVGIEEDTSVSKILLSQVYPNLSKSLILIKYSLSASGKVCLRVFDASGRLVKNLVAEYQKRGSHTISWDGRDDKGRTLPSGVYFCELKTPKFSKTCKIIILK